MKIQWNLGDKTVFASLAPFQLPAVSVEWLENKVAVQRTAECNFRFPQISSENLLKIANSLQLNFYPVVSRLSDDTPSVSFFTRGLGGCWGCLCGDSKDKDNARQPLVQSARNPVKPKASSGGGFSMTMTDPETGEEVSRMFLENGKGFMEDLKTKKRIPLPDAQTQELLALEKTLYGASQGST